MWLVVVASAAGGAIVGSRPTGLRAADVLLTAAFAGLVALAGAYARRWSWLVAAGIAVAAAGSGKEAVVCAVASILIGFVAVALNARSLGMGAAAAGLAVQALLRLPDFVAQGVPSLLAALAVVPLFVSAYRYAPGRGRRRTRKYAFYAGSIAFGLFGIGIVAALLARAHVEDGISGAQSGFENVQNGERDASVAALNQSAAEFGSAADILGSWWAAPVRALPIIGQQVDAVHTMAEEGHTLAVDASQAAAVIDYEQLRVRGGAIDLELLRSAQVPIAKTASALEAAREHLQGLSVGWLFPPVRDRFDLFMREIGRAGPAAAVARDVITVAPELLGADTPQHYLVLFGSPAETRELGGFVGNFAEVTADKGKLTLTRSGRALELSDPKGAAGFTLTPGDYVEPFLQYRVTQFFGNVTASANFPDVANVAEQLYPQTGGVPLDGVFYMDPYALEQLLDLTGPITLKGGDNRTKLTSKNAARTLLVDQYVDIPVKGERVDFLDEATRLTFEQLTTGDLPKPVKVANVMNPMVEQGRLFAQSTHPQIQALFEQLALDGSIPARNGGDYLSVTQSNENPSKIDAYLQRDVTYDATYFPDTGQVDGDVKIRLTNSVPSTDLPEDVVGNANGLPVGTNHLFLNVYSPLGAVGATINGVPTGLGSIKRFGLSAYTVVVDVPPGGTVTVEIKLAGIVDRSRQYQLTVVRQPTVNSDHIDVTLNTRDGWRIVSFPGFQLDRGTGKASIGEGRSEILTAHLDTR
ncbi:MAG: hypothetical protein QOD92_1300 [Acidimicrobiaceae bacterium]|jgi:hypothetical protein